MDIFEEPEGLYGEPKVHKHGFTGLWIPAEIVLNKEVGWIEKCIYSYIHSLSKAEKGCFASNEYLAKVFSISASSISKYISNLKKVGLIKESGFNGRFRKLETTTKYYNQNE